MAERKGIQLAYPFEERRLLNQGRFQLTWRPPYLVQPKLNGERCRMIVQNGRCLLLSSSEDIIPAVPHINSAGLMLPNGEYDGELYKHGLSWAEIHSIVSRETSMHPNYGVMEYHVFDVVVESISQADRLRILSAIDLYPPILRVPTEIAWSLEELYSIYDRYISNNYEGFIVREMNGVYRRNRTPAMMKFKPKQSDTYPILSLYEAISADGKPKGMVGGFNCVDDMGTLFSVGAGKLTHDKRKMMWQEWLDNPNAFIGKHLLLEYQTMSDKNKVPLFSRAVEVIR